MSSSTEERVATLERQLVALVGVCGALLESCNYLASGRSRTAGHVLDRAADALVDLCAELEPSGASPPGAWADRVAARVRALKALQLTAAAARANGA